MYAKILRNQDAKLKRKNAAYMHCCTECILCKLVHY